MSIFNDTFFQKQLENLLISGFSQGTFNGTSGNEIQFLFSWPPEVLDDKQYINPWTANNPSGLMSSTENISRLVNPIPFINTHFTPSANTVEDVYGNLILSASITDQSSSDQSTNQSFSTSEANLFSSRTISQAKTSSIKDKLSLNQERESIIELERKISLEIADNIISGNTSPKRIQSNQNTLRSLVKKLSPLQEEASSRFLSGSIKQINPTKKSSLFRTPSFNKDLSIVGKSFYDARIQFDTTSLSSTLNPKTSYHPSYMIPNNFSDEAASKAWPSLSTTLKDSKQQDVKVSFSYTRADITRPWFMGYLMSMGGWTLKGQAPGWLSNGSKINNPGIFPLLTLSLLLCRNMKITGPNSNYESIGLQIIARCCQVTPKMAPD
ncbi:hypothetical protein KZP23_11725 [Echinicola marina]|uniref:hypothetical protein n=1 Tax=Echinicola marina TaxID=2859768 RepID=UPI001CF6A49B|nr:hypothetical protein [Echinicola marina]UCS95630.1 hypothetical protein KZP23_11725 [Echinicola marina]